jgi:hypothetical protein
MTTYTYSEARQQLAALLDIKTDLTTEEVVDMIRDGRER